MKDYLFLYVFVLSFFFSNAITNARIVYILTPKVASNGLLILATSGIIKSLKKEDNPSKTRFQLKIQNTNSNTQIGLSCFVYQFEDQISYKIGCFTRGLAPGKYIILPLSTTVTLVTENSLRIQLRMDPSNIAGRTFEVTEGNELYFYDYGKNEEDFEYSGHVEDIEFSLFEPASGPKTIYFKDIPITCYAVQYKLTCNLYSNKFPNNRKTQLYDVFIKDSLGNTKRNFFVQIVNITLNYL